MKKGKFGLVLSVYPIVAFACVILKAPLVCSIVLALAVFIEHDEWTGRQTFQAWLLAAIVYLCSDLLPRLVSLISKTLIDPLKLVTSSLKTGANLLGVAVHLAAILLSILGIIRVAKGGEANLPFCTTLAYWVYGQRKPHTGQDDDHMK